MENGPARARQYPWGLISIDAPVPRTSKPMANSSHSLLTLSSTAVQTECCGNDLFPMQKMLIRSHFEFLKRHTVEKLYENYRTEIVCHVLVAPEAPMRLNKSREALKDSDSNAEQQSQSQSQQPQAQAQQSQLQQAHAQEDEDDELFQSTPLSPINEEEEALKAASIQISGEKKSKKLKKSCSKTLKQISSENLAESHDDLVSPLPGIQ